VTIRSPGVPLADEASAEVSRSPDYLDFDILIQRGPDALSASVIASPAGEAAVSFALPAALDTVTDGGGQWSTEAVRAAGVALFESVFAGEVLACYRSSYAEARRRGCRLRLRFRLGNAADLAWVPWEFLHDPQRGFLAAFADTTIVRYLQLPDVGGAFRLDGPLHILVVLSNPEDPSYEKLDVERERTAIQLALGPLQRRGRVTIEFLDDARLEVLHERVQTGRFHVLHFVGHSALDSTGDEGLVVLEDAAGRGKPISAAAFRGILADRDLRLVVLNSCESARAGRGGLFSGVAQALVQAGVPAVVAMQFAIRDDAAGTLVAALYRELALSRPIDSAVAEARKSVLPLGGTAWAAPVVFFRKGDGRLFAPPRPSVAQRLLRATPYALLTLNWLLVLFAVKSAWYYFVGWKEYLPIVASLLGGPAILAYFIPVNWAELISGSMTRPDGRPRPVAASISILLSSALVAAGMVTQPTVDMALVRGSIRHEAAMGIPQLDPETLTRKPLCDVGDLPPGECEKPLPAENRYLRLSYRLRWNTVAAYRLLLTVEPDSSVGFADLRTDPAFEVTSGTDRANVAGRNGIWIASATEPGIGTLTGTVEVCLVARAKPTLSEAQPAILRASLATDREGKEVSRGLEACWSLRDAVRVDCAGVTGGPVRSVDGQ
jgi:hypothetical protein